MIDKQIAEASALLRDRLRAVMKRKGFKRQEDLCQYLGMSRATIGPYFWPKNSTLPTTDTLNKLREKIPAITDADAKIIEMGYSRKSSLTRSGSRKNGGSTKTRSTAPKSVAATQPRIAPVSASEHDAKIGHLLRQLMAECQQGGNGKAIATDPYALLSSQASGRYQVGDMPYILRKETFAIIDISQWSVVDKQHFLEYANLVLEESRKCLLLLAQFQPDAMREDLLGLMGKNADLLWRTYNIASSVAPIEYVKDIDMARKCGALT